MGTFETNYVKTIGAQFSRYDKEITWYGWDGHDENSITVILSFNSIVGLIAYIKQRA
jgi:hypothetical protein